MSNEQPKSKFSEFLTSKKLDPRRVLSASEAIEKLRPEDRAIRLARRLKKPDAPKAAAEAGDKKKPRSGRPLTRRAMNSALAGQPLSGPQKTRFLRAVNRLLEQKKQEPATLDLLFLALNTGGRGVTNLARARAAAHLCAMLFFATFALLGLVLADLSERPRSRGRS